MIVDFLFGTQLPGDFRSGYRIHNWWEYVSEVTSRAMYVVLQAVNSKVIYIRVEFQYEVLL